MTDKHIIHEHAHVSLSRFGAQVGNGSKLPKLINWDWETKYTKNSIPGKMYLPVLASEIFIR